MDATFEDFWKAYPHHATRSSKAMAKSKWNAITGQGLSAKVRDKEGNTMLIDLQATADEIVKGAKAYAVSLDDRQYAQGAQVWLNQGRWMDFDNVDELAARYDRVQEHKAQLEARGKLRAVS